MSSRGQSTFICVAQIHKKELNIKYPLKNIYLERQTSGKRGDQVIVMILCIGFLEEWGRESSLDL